MNFLMLCCSLIRYSYESGMYAILYMQKWVGSQLSRSINPIRHLHSSSYSYVTNMNHPYLFLTITILHVCNDTREIRPQTIQACSSIDMWACKWSPIKYVVQHILLPLITPTYSHSIIKSRPQYNGPSLLCIIQWFTS